MHMYLKTRRVKKRDLILFVSWLLRCTYGSSVCIFVIVVQQIWMAWELSVQARRFWVQACTKKLSGKQICCTIKWFPWKLDNLSHLYFNTFKTTTICCKEMKNEGPHALCSIVYECPITELKWILQFCTLNLAQSSDMQTGVQSWFCYGFTRPIYFGLPKS